MKTYQKMYCVMLAIVIMNSFFLTRVSQGQEELFTIDDYFQVKSMRVSAMTDDGQWLVCTFSTPADRLGRDNYRYGDPTYIAPSQSEPVLMNIETGRQRKIFSSKEQVSSLTLSDDEQMLAFFIMRNGQYRLQIWHRNSERFEDIDVSEHGEIASNSHLIWSEDGEKLFFALRAADWEKKGSRMFDTAVNGPIIVHDTDKPFLMWDEVKNKSRLMIPVMYDRKIRRLKKLLPETSLLSVRMTKDGQFMIFERDVTEKTDYERIGGAQRQVEVLAAAGGEPRVLFTKEQNIRPTWREDNMVFAYAEEGDIFIQGINDDEPRNLTKGVEEPQEKIREIRETKEPKEKKRFSVSRFSTNGRRLLCTSRRELTEDERPDEDTTSLQEYWVIETESGDREMIWEQPPELTKDARLSLAEWKPDEQVMYFGYAATNKYDRGLIKLDLKTKKMTDLIRSDHIYGNWRISKDGQTVLFTDADGDRPEDWYVTDPDFRRVRRLTTLNPQLDDKALSHTELIKYRDTDGDELYGVLYYPANYEKGKKYPLVTEVYENYFNNGFSSTLNILTSAGYAVLHPSVDLETGYPGEAWAKGALSAINKVIDMGVADPERLGIQGTSYGGYATVLLITQTDRFKAAINNSGKVNMVSFYTQSPRYGIRNIHAPERSQDRIGGTLWQYPQRYLAHSAILYADRIKTPLLCITGDQDPNVEAFQSQEIYYALRRLGKKCVWLRYHNGAHGGPNTNDERRDMYQRMLDWYDAYLKVEK